MGRPHVFSNCRPLHSRCPFLTLLCQLGSASGVIGASESMAGTGVGRCIALAVHGSRAERHGGEAPPWPLLGLGDSPAGIWSRTENRMCWTPEQSSALSTRGELFTPSPQVRRQGPWSPSQSRFCVGPKATSNTFHVSGTHIQVPGIYSKVLWCAHCPRGPQSQGGGPRALRGLVSSRDLAVALPRKKRVLEPTSLCT